MISQRIVMARPPIFDECRLRFGPSVDRAIFSWGDMIYNPAGIDIPPSLLAHEAVHGARQLANPVSVLQWWRSYLDVPAFRMAEEVAAHRAEWMRVLVDSPSRHDRRRMMKLIAGRLSSPLYGRMVSLEQAKRLIAEAA